MIYFLNAFGTAVFAIGGALSAARKGMDLFGVVVAAVLTGIGGGTLRDLCLGVRPVNWVTDSTSLQIAAVFGLLTFAYLHLRQSEAIPLRILNVADAIGLAVFTGTRMQDRGGSRRGCADRDDNGNVNRIRGRNYPRCIFRRDTALFSQGDLCHRLPCRWSGLSSSGRVTCPRRLGHARGHECHTPHQVGSNLLGLVLACVDPRGGRP